MLKERASGMYRLSAFYLARTASDIPSDLSIPSLFIGIVCESVLPQAGGRLGQQGTRGWQASSGRQQTGGRHAHRPTHTQPQPRSHAPVLPRSHSLNCFTFSPHFVQT
jgi:hypothetical protein